jgi:CPA1 family monovalent cation:H+ antiporter
MPNPFLSELFVTISLLSAVLLLVHFARHSPLPYPAVMALAGLGIGLIPSMPTIQLNPNVVLNVFLPPLLYYAAWFTSWPEFRRNLRAVSFLAFGLVLVTIAAVALVAKYLLPDMPWAVAALLGAILSPPDAIAATVVCRRAHISPRLMAIIEGESLINDAGALVAFRTSVAAALTGAVSWTEIGSSFLLAGLGGILCGLCGGRLVAALHRRVKCDTFTSLGLSLLAPYFVFIFAESIHASGVLAVVVTGIMVSRESPRLLTPAGRVVGHSVWAVFTLLLNALAFTLVGLQIRIIDIDDSGLPLRGLVTVCLSTLAVIVAVRFLFVALTARMATGSGFLEREHGMTLRHHLVVAWTAMRGVVSLAAVLSVPTVLHSGQAFPYRSLLLSVTFFVVLATLVLQSLLLPLIISKLGLQAHGEITQQRNVARQTLGKISGFPCGDGHSCAITSLMSKEQVLSGREALLVHRDRGEIGEDIFRELETLLDLRELSLTERVLADI